MPSQRQSQHREGRAPIRRERRLCRLQFVSNSPMKQFHPCHTSRHTMHFVLNEEVEHRNQSRKESRTQPFPILDSIRIRRAQQNATNGPGNCRDQIADHEDIVPVMVIRARNVCPSTTRQRPQDSDTCDKLGQTAALSVRDAVPQEDEHEAWSRAYGDEDLEDGAFGVSIAYRRAD